MKTKLILLTSVFALALCTFGVSTTIAQGTTTTDAAPTPPPAKKNSGKKNWLPPGITQEQWDTFLKTKKEVIKDTPELKTEEEAMKAAHKKGEKPTADEKAAFQKQREDFEAKLKAAVLAKDPSLSAVYEALEKGHAGKGKKGAAPAS